MYSVGTIAYVIDEEALLVKVNKGWQYIAVSFNISFMHDEIYNFLFYQNLAWNFSPFNNTTNYYNITQLIRIPRTSRSESCKYK